MREIGRRAEHRNFHSLIGRDAPKLAGRTWLLKLEKAGVKLQPVQLKLRPDVNPFAQRHGTADAEGIHVCLGERSQSWHQSPFFTGLRPIMGYCSNSITLPLIGLLSS